MIRNTYIIALFALILSATSLLEAKSVQAQDQYAAIAYSPANGCWGYSYGANSRNEAETQAVGSANCSQALPMVWVKNGYIALALSNDKQAYGWAWAATAEQAKMLALREARKKSSNCYIAVCVHSHYGKQ